MARTARPTRPRPRHKLGDTDRFILSERGIETAGNATAGLDLMGKDRKLLDQNGRLNGIEARVHANPHMLIRVAALAVHTKGSQDRGKFIVIGEAGAAIAVTAKRFGGKEARARSVAEGD